MASLREKLTTIFQDAFERIGLDGSLGAVEESGRPELGQFQCNGALPAAKARKENPRAIAESVVELLKEETIFADLSLAGPGFINITVTDEYLGAWLRELAEDERLGVASLGEPGRIVADYGGPNVAKEMHVGHLRSSIIGDSIVRTMRFMGDQVTSDIHLGDWGLQMGQLIVELKLRRPDLVYFDPNVQGPYPDESPVTLDDLQEIYPVAAARCKPPAKDADIDEATRTELEAAAAAAREEARIATAELQAGRAGYMALWRHFHSVSMDALRRDFSSLGVEFDYWYGESDAQKWIPQLFERLNAGGFVEESQGAQVIFLPPEEEEKEIPPLILVNRDGGVGYGTTDLATIVQRVEEFNPTEILYIVDQRQANHFDQLFRAARRSGISGNARLEHLGFGTMNGPDGKPFKTREGGTLKLSILIETAAELALKKMREGEMVQDYPIEEQEEIARKVGIATLKYADLMNHRTSNYIFDLEKFTAFEGRTGAYLLYMAVRCKSVLRKAAERGFQAGAILSPGDRERELMLLLASLPDAVEMAYSKRAPNYLCEYIFNLAQGFSKFWANCHILTEEDPSLRASWLSLVTLTLRQFELGMGLLGIDVPERM